MDNTVIVTGAAGYIGGTICILLKRKGYQVIGIDKRILPDYLKPFVDTFEHCCFTHSFSLQHVENKPKAIIHCAGTSLVGPSVTNPEEYYDNNVAKTIQYLAHIRRHSPETKFIFSSSASVYGNPEIDIPLDEEFPTNPISPYGHSKLMVEIILDSYRSAYNLKSVSFRYFNACGAVKDGLHGQEPNATHIFARIFDALKNADHFYLNGVDYPTPDKTCIRDYIHVEDIAEAHILAIENNMQGIYNIGTEDGYSNLEVCLAVQNYLSNHTLSIVYRDRREGDPAVLVSTPLKLYNETGWVPKNSINDIVKDLNDWYSSDNYAKRSSAIIPL